DVTAAGSITVDDSLRGFPNGRVRFEVRDHGEGIDPEMVPRIFERFYRLDVSRTRDTGGSGLGLSIVKAIVENHHGTISVQETSGGGATFRIDLPISETGDSTAEARKDERCVRTTIPRIRMNRSATDVRPRTRTTSHH